MKNLITTGASAVPEKVIVTGLLTAIFVGGLFLDITAPAFFGSYYGYEPTPTPTPSPSPSPTPFACVGDTLYFEDFESGGGAWTLDGSVGPGNGLWRVTSDCEAVLPGHSADHVLGYSLDGVCTYDNGLPNSGTATSPPIDLTMAAPPVRLGFNFFLETEDLCAYDSVQVLVSDDGFASSAVIAGNCVPGNLADPSHGWIGFSTDISAMAGSVIQVRFTFLTNDSVFNGFPGFLVDDIEVCAVMFPTPTPSPTSSAAATPSPAAPTPSPDTPTPTATAAATSPVFTPSPSACCPGDADNSGSFVDANDFIAVQANFGADNGVGGPGDADCGGSFVDANDFIAVQANFGADCG